jgi:hypothetical protein
MGASSMTTLEHVQHGLLLLWVITAASQLLLHGLVVRRLLRQHGDPFWTGFFPWRVWFELRKYRGLLQANARTLNSYHFCLILLWFNLLLGLTLGLLVLWQRTSPTGAFR